MTKFTGFKRTPQEPLSSIEMALGVEFEKNKEPDSWKAFRGVWIDVFFDGFEASGVYRGITSDGALVLQPSAYRHEQWLDSLDKNARNNFVWKDLPSLYNVPSMGHRPSVRAYLEKWARNFDHVASQGTFFGDTPANESNTLSSGQ